MSATLPSPQRSTESLLTSNDWPALKYRIDLCIRTRSTSHLTVFDPAGVPIFSAIPYLIDLLAARGLGHDGVVFRAENVETRVMSKEEVRPLVARDFAAARAYWRILLEEVLEIERTGMGFEEREEERWRQGMIEREIDEAIEREVQRLVEREIEMEIRREVEAMEDGEDDLGGEEEESSEGN